MRLGNLNSEFSCVPDYIMCLSPPLNLKILGIKTGFINIFHIEIETKVLSLLHLKKNPLVYVLNCLNEVIRSKTGHFIVYTKSLFYAGLFYAFVL